jgi:diguanylate cyclase (GGDEF)-like protein
MKFHIAGLCCTDGSGFAFHNGFSLIILSYLAAAAGSFTALEMIERSRSPRTARALSRHVARATARGGIALSICLIGIVALQFALPVSYAPAWIVYSLFIAFGAAGCGLQRVRQTKAREAKVLQRTNAELMASYQQLQAAICRMPQGFTFFSADKKLIVCNPSYNEMYRLSPQQTQPGTPLSDILDCHIATGTFADMSKEDYLARREALTRAAQPCDITVELQDGRTVSLHYRPLPDGGWVATHEDVSERRQTEREIVFIARHDALTRLPNRVTFQERMEEAVDMAARGNKCALLCVDIDNLRDVNDALGHAGGDSVLKGVAERLKACVREGDMVARLGGDEFAIIQQTITQPDDGEILANRIIKAFEKPFDVEGRRIEIGLSVGVTLLPDDGTTADRLLKNADMALYLAKTEGRGKVRFFEPEMDARIQARRVLERDLRQAISRNELELFYQPSIDLATGRISAFEALLRWHHPARGLVSPVEFVPLAEETGMIVAIGEWALRTACQEAMNWPDGISVAVNLSPIQFKKRTPVAAVKSALEASGLPADRLVLEITESVLLEDAPSTLAALHQLRALGIAVALDDFGTGYSSLSYLHRFPFDKLKIDRSFVHDMMNNKESMSIIRAVTGLGQSLRMDTIAEGVETLEQLNLLRDEGCTEVQGYYFSRPKPACDLPLLIKTIHEVSDCSDSVATIWR